MKKKKTKMIIFIVVGVIALLAVAFFILSSVFSGFNKTEQADAQTVLNGTGSGKVLVLYQESQSDFLKSVVDYAAKNLNEKGNTVVMNHPRSDSSYNVQDYDIIVLASPVYAGKVSEPLLNYADSQDFTGKKVLVLVTGMLDGSKEVDKIKEHTSSAERISGIKLRSLDEAAIDKLIDELLA